MPVDVLHVLPPVQSAFALHSTHVPAMSPLLVLPQTCAAGSPPDMHGVPVGAGSKCGASGVPWQAGWIRHALFDTGRSVGSSTDVVPPAPLHTTLWQSPGVCRLPGAVELPGYAHAPETLQSVAPHAATLAGQLADVQQ